MHVKLLNASLWPIWLNVTRSLPAHHVLNLVGDPPLRPRVQALLALARPVLLLVALRQRGHRRVHRLLVAAPLVMSAACLVRMNRVVEVHALLLAEANPVMANLRAVPVALRALRVA